MKDEEKSFSEQFAKIVADAILSQVDRSVNAGLDVHKKFNGITSGSLENETGE